MVKDTSIELFLDDLAGQKPTPSGGSAAAVMGAMGAALVSAVMRAYRMPRLTKDETATRAEVIQTALKTRPPS